MVQDPTLRTKARFIRYTRYIFPLVVTTLALSLTGPLLNAGMARLPDAAETLAAFALAFGITTFLASPLHQVHNVSLSLVTGESTRRATLRFVMAAGAVFSTVLLLLAATGLGPLVVEEWHGVSGSLAATTIEAFFYLVPLPWISGLIRHRMGVLMKYERTADIGYATFAKIALSAAMVLLLLPMSFVQDRPILLPVIATYVGLAGEWVVLSRGFRRKVRPLLEAGDAEPARSLSQGAIFRFFWPLGLTMAVQGFSRPLVNLFVSREVGGEIALAVLAVVYPLAHTPYGWLNELRSLKVVFGEAMDRGALRRYFLTCGVVSFVTMAGLFWVAPLRDWILLDLIGVTIDLAERCALPLILFSFFPLVVTVRSYFHGEALRCRTTGPLAPSGPVRIVAILAGLIWLPGAGLSGAALGIAALLGGFLAETVVVVAGVLRVSRRNPD